MGQVDSKPLSIRYLDRYVREPINCLSHLLGAFLSLVGMIALLILSWGEPWRVMSFAVYGFSSIVLYLASSLLHGLRVRPERRRLLLRLDHLGIFALIAGSYTPLALISLKSYNPTWGWTLFALVWGLATLGVIFKMRWLDAPHWLSTGFYLLMGWLAVFALGPIRQALSEGFFWLILGGIFYSVGAVIFALRRPNFFPGVFGHHELWHLFVLAGGISHFVMFFNYVAPH